MVKPTELLLFSSSDPIVVPSFDLLKFQSQFPVTNSQILLSKSILRYIQYILYLFTYNILVVFWSPGVPPFPGHAPLPAVTNNNLCNICRQFPPPEDLCLSGNYCANPDFPVVYIELNKETLHQVQVIISGAMKRGAQHNHSTVLITAVVIGQANLCCV